MRKHLSVKKAGRKMLMLFGTVVTVWGMAFGAAEADNGYIISDSDTRYISYSEIKNMSAQVICYAKNEIYARNGRKFQSKELQNYFNEQYWYYGTINPDAFSASYLNQYETANVDLLDQREKELVSGGYVLDTNGYSYDPVYAYSAIWSYAGFDDGCVVPDSSSRYMTPGEIKMLTLQEICYAKNEIYARHGRKFQSQELTDYFNSKSWYYGYIEPNDFSASVFNSYETANIDMLQQAEQERKSGGYVLDQPGYNIYAVTSSEYTGSYLDSEYIFYDSDSRYLSDAEVNSLSCQMACYAKNEIYARHGRKFQSQELTDYFNSKSWYFGTVSAENFSSGVFNKYEVANIEALQNREFSLNASGYQLR